MARPSTSVSDSKLLSSQPQSPQLTAVCFNVVVFMLNLELLVELRTHTKRLFFNAVKRISRKHVYAVHVNRSPQFDGSVYFTLLFSRRKLTQFHCRCSIFFASFSLLPTCEWKGRKRHCWSLVLSSQCTPKDVGCVNVSSELWTLSTIDGGLECCENRPKRKWKNLSPRLIHAILECAPLTAGKHQNSSPTATRPFEHTCTVIDHKRATSFAFYGRKLTC